MRSLKSLRNLKHMYYFYRERYRILRDMNRTFGTLSYYAKTGLLFQATKKIESETKALQLIIINDPSGLDADFEMLQKLGYCYLSQALLNRLEKSGIIDIEDLAEIPQSY